MVAQGVRLSLPAEQAGAPATLRTAEQRRCPFFDLRLHLDGPVVHLEARAFGQAAELRDLLPTA